MSAIETTGGVKGKYFSAWDLYPDRRLLSACQASSTRREISAESGDWWKGTSCLTEDSLKFMPSDRHEQLCRAHRDVKGSKLEVEMAKMKIHNELPSKNKTFRQSSRCNANCLDIVLRA